MYFDVTLTYATATETLKKDSIEISDQYYQ
jgi:hypothetical protein